MPHVTGTRSSHLLRVHSDSVMWDSPGSHLYTPCVSTEGPREEPRQESNRLTRQRQPPCSVLPGLFLTESSKQPNELRCYPSPHFCDEGTVAQSAISRPKVRGRGRVWAQAARLRGLCCSVHPSMLHTGRRALGRLTGSRGHGQPCKRQPKMTEKIKTHCFLRTDHEGQ